MPVYTQYTYLDFIEDESFRRGVYAPDSAEGLFWSRWVQAHPYKEKEVETARAILLSIRGGQAGLSTDKVKKNVSGILEQINKSGNTAHIQTSRPWFPVMAAAACLVLAFLIGWFWVKQPGSPEAQRPTVAAASGQVTREIINKGATARKVTLPDGSVIYLLRHSKISFPEPFNQTYREVNLSGEAFFEIAKNPSRPFYVYAGELVTKVLGTSFLIKAYEKDRQVKVIVKTGKVAVFASKDPIKAQLPKDTEANSLLLTPNQQAVLLRSETRLIRTQTTPPVLPATPVVRKLFNYDRAAVADVFEDLEKAYGIDILFDASQMQNCTITAQLEKESLAEKLQLVCMIVEGEYELVDNIVIIRSKACQ
jgi:transmembrane sensor